MTWNAALSSAERARCVRLTSNERFDLSSARRAGVSASIRPRAYRSAPDAGEQEVDNVVGEGRPDEQPGGLGTLLQQDLRIAEHRLSASALGPRTRVQVDRAGGRQEPQTAGARE